MSFWHYSQIRRFKTKNTIWEFSYEIRLGYQLGHYQVHWLYAFPFYAATTRHQKISTTSTTLDWELKEQWTVLTEIKKNYLFCFIGTDILMITPFYKSIPNTISTTNMLSSCTRLCINTNQQRTNGAKIRVLITDCTQTSKVATQLSMRNRI